MIIDLRRQHRRWFLKIAGLTSLTLLMPSHATAQSGTKTKIGVIGAGHIGSTIGSLWVKAGHSVLFSSRHPEEIKPMAESLGALAQIGTVAEALDFSNVVLVAVPYKALPELAKDLGPKFAGKIVIDPTNAVARRDGEDLVAETKEKGIGITTASFFPGANVVRAFNSMSYAKFSSEAHRTGEAMAIPIAGDDAHAVAIVAELVRDAGFDAVAVPLSRAQEFAQGGPLYDKQLTAKELRDRFGLGQ